MYMKHNRMELLDTGEEMYCIFCPLHLNQVTFADRHNSKQQGMAEDIKHALVNVKHRSTIFKLMADRNSC